MLPTLSRVDMFRLVASMSIECARMGIVVIGGIGIGWDGWSPSLELDGEGWGEAE